MRGGVELFFSRTFEDKFYARSPMFYGTFIVAGDFSFFARRRVCIYVGVCVYKRRGMFFHECHGDSAGALEISHKIILDVGVQRNYGGFVEFRFEEQSGWTK